MRDPFIFADEIGPSKILHLYEPSVGLRAVVVVDNVAIGPAIGGVRMVPDLSTEEAFRLARAMTLKNAAAGLAHGGAKSVIQGDPEMPPAHKERLIRAFARAMAHLHEYIPGPDMGTDERAMAWVHDEIGRAVGLPREFGGIPLDEIGATGWGLVHAIEVAFEHLDRSLSGARFVVQGFGAVGSHTARFLAERGAVLVGAADIEGTLSAPHGLDVDKLLALHRQGGSVMDYPGATKGGRDDVLDIECDIWIPAARPDVVNSRNVHRLRTRLVAQGANIPCTPEAERRLHARGVLVLPDFIANAGGVICGAVEYSGGDEKTAMATIAEKIRENTGAMLTEARRDGVTPRASAGALAHRRVLRAMSLRRIGRKSEPEIPRPAARLIAG